MSRPGVDEILGLAIYSSIDGVIGAVQTTRAIITSDINVYKSGHENVNVMWTYSCLFAKQHDLLKLKLVEEHKPEVNITNL